MELRTYLQILVKRWWIVVPVFVITVAFTALFTLSQAPVYSATATFVVSPSPSSLDARGVLSGLDALGGKSLVANTYAEVATSRAVREEAARALGLDPLQSGPLVAGSKLRAGTNVIEITVEGTDPVLAAAFANEVGNSTVSYVAKLYEVYDLKPLDAATLPVDPVRPNVKLNLVLGAILGLALGAGLAFAFEYLHIPAETKRKVGTLDDESGARNEYYFDHRLTEEMSRARRRQYPLSVALMNVDLGRVIQQSVPSEFVGGALQMVTAFCKQSLREEDVLARLQGTTFGMLLPDMSEKEARALLEKLQTKMTGIDFEIEQCGVKLNLHGACGLVSYDGNGTGRDDLLARAYHALKRAEAGGAGKVVSLPEALAG